MKGRYLFAFLLLIAAAATICFAQESRATLLGRVLDPTGAAVPKASLKVTNVLTGVAIPVQTNEHGNYRAPYLIPGVYRISVEAPGFKRLERDGIELRVNDRVEINLSLEVGQAQQEVTVTAEAPLLDTTNADLGQVVDAKRVAQLPVPHGNPFQLMKLAAGVAWTGETGADQPFDFWSGVYAINGSRAERAEFTIDNASTTATFNNNEVLPAESPMADLVAEFKIQTSAFDASVGQTEGAVVNIAMKSGTNNFHGTAYFVKMAPEMTANLFFANRAGQPRSDFTYNRWGGTIGGPVIKNRTFFMYGYEGIHNSRPRGSTLTVPTEAERGGDFSSLLALGSAYQIYDPSSRQVVENGRFQENPFHGNIIPKSRISPIATNILKYYAMPTTDGTADGRNNLPLPGEPETNKYWTHTIRMDHALSDRQRVFGRWNRLMRDSVLFDWFKNEASGQFFNFYSDSATLDDVFTFSPTFVMNVRASATHFIRTYDGHPEGKGFDLTKLGFPASYNNLIPEQVRRFPYITIDGYANTWVGTLWKPTDTFDAAATFDKVRGNHAFQFGGGLRIYRENQYNDDNASTGVFNFSSDWTRGPYDNSPAAPIGQGLASMLLGLPTSGSVDRRASYAEESTVWSSYFQDVWKATRKLSITLGLRYELEGPLTERFNRSVRGFDYDAVLPIEAAVKQNYALNPVPGISVDQFNIRGGVLFAGMNGQPRTLYDRDTNNLMPRIGFAYSLNSKTVLRGGYGVFFGFLGARRYDVSQTGFSRTTSLIPSYDGGLTFAATLSNPFPDGIFEPQGSALGVMTNVGNWEWFYNTKPQAPRNQKFEISIQRELPGRIVVEAAYAGNRGNDLETANRNLSTVPRQFLSTKPTRDDGVINSLSTWMPSPFYPLLAGTSMGSAWTQAYTLTSQYPQFTWLGTTTNDGKSWYNSLQLKGERRFSKGFTLQGNYTFSKFLDSTYYMNESDALPTRMITEQDFPHRVVVSGIFELPFGRGKALLSHTRGVLGSLVGGWQVQGIYTFQSGPPLNWGNIIFNGDLRDVVLPSDQRTPERWINTDAGFERAWDKQLAWNIRTFPWQFGFLRSEGMNNWDLSAIKNTRVKEGMDVEFRGEFLNAFNHVTFASPDLWPSNSTFGQVTAEKSTPRRIQLGLKLVF